MGFIYNVLAFRKSTTYNLAALVVKFSDKKKIFLQKVFNQN